MFPSGEQYFPGGQGRHSSTLFKPVRGLNVPLGQGIGSGSYSITEKTNSQPMFYRDTEQFLQYLQEDSNGQQGMHSAVS